MLVWAELLIQGGCKHGHHTDLDHRKSQVQLNALHRNCTALGKNRKESFCQSLVSDLQLPCDLDQIISSLIIHDVFKKCFVTKNRLHSQAFQKYKSSKLDLRKLFHPFFFAFEMQVDLKHQELGILEHHMSSAA